MSEEEHRARTHSSGTAELLLEDSDFAVGLHPAVATSQGFCHVAGFAGTALVTVDYSVLAVLLVGVVCSDLGFLCYNNDFVDPGEETWEVVDGGLAEEPFLAAVDQRFRSEP